MWNPGLPGPMSGGFCSIVSDTGEVICLQVVSEKLARQICDDHNAIKTNALKNLIRKWRRKADDYSAVVAHAYFDAANDLEKLIKAKP